MPFTLTIFVCQNNILVDKDGNACITDLGLLRTSDLTTASSCTQYGNPHWMSPELLDPTKFGLEESRTTESSDCYALGTVVYEVLSRRVPFDERTRYAVVSRVLEGGRPERPEGTKGRWFTDAVWSVLEDFWKPEPNSRPPVDSVFRCLDETSNT